VAGSEWLEVVGSGLGSGRLVVVVVAVTYCAVHGSSGLCRQIRIWYILDLDCMRAVLL
jgi:hypothetical protein